MSEVALFLVHKKTPLPEKTDLYYQHGQYVSPPTESRVERGTFMNTGGTSIIRCGDSENGW